MIVLARTNKLGTFTGTGATPPGGKSTTVLTADLAAECLHDPNHRVRLQIHADFGAGPKWMASSPVWAGTPASVRPTLSWAFDPTHPPLRVYGVLENGAPGETDPPVCGLKLVFN